MQSLALVSKDNKLISRLCEIWEKEDAIVNVFGNKIAVISSKGRVYMRFWGDAKNHYESDVIENIDKIISDKKYYYLVYYSNLEMLFYFVKNSKLLNCSSLINEKKSNLWLDFSKNGY